MVRQTRKKAWRRNKLFPYLMLTPTLILLCTFTFYPFLRSIYLSFFVTSPLGKPGAFVGIQNYIRVLTSEGFLKSLSATFKYAGMVGLGTFTVAMVFALLCIREVHGGKVYQTMFALPMAVASVPISALALYLFSKYGLINQWFGIQLDWLSDERTALATCALVTVWSCVGSSFIYLLVGFRNVSKDVVEAATLDGAGPLRKIFSVYFPLASPQIFFVAFLNILTAFKAFGIIKLLTGKGPNDSTNILVYAVYSSAFTKSRFETACVYSIILCLIIFLVTRVQLLMEKRMVHYQ